MTSEELETRFSAIEADIDHLKHLRRADRQELGANTRATLVFIGGVTLMVMLGSKFIEGRYSYSLDLQGLSLLLGAPAIASLAAMAAGLISKKQ